MMMANIMLQHYRCAPPHLQDACRVSTSITIAANALSTNNLAVHSHMSSDGTYHDCEALCDCELDALTTLRDVLASAYSHGIQHSTASLCLTGSTPICTGLIGHEHNSLLSNEHEIRYQAQAPQKGHRSGQ